MSASASHVSRVLAQARFRRSRSTSTSVRGYRHASEGYTVRQFGASVQVDWCSGSSVQRSADYDRAAVVVDDMRHVLEQAGYRVAVNSSGVRSWLVVQ